MKWKIALKPVVACLLCTWLSMGTGVRLVTAAPPEQQQAATPTRIQSVLVRGEGKSAELIIAASSPTTYTSYKSAAPARLVIDFSQTAPAESLANLSISKGPIKGVAVKRFDTDAGVLTRMEVFLSQDVDPVISPSQDRVGELVVSFPGYVEPPATTQPFAQEPLKQVDQPGVEASAGAVDTTQPAEDAEIKSQADGQLSLVTGITAAAGGVTIVTNRPVADFKTFRLSKPERVVVDIPHARIGMAEKLIMVNSAGISTARIGSYPDKVRIVFDAINGSLADAVITKNDKGLHVAFAAEQTAHPETRTAPQTAASTNKAAAAQAVAPADAATVATKSAVTAVAAQVAAVDFQVVGDISRVMVKVSGSPVVEQPVKLPGSVAYRIKNVQLPRNLQRSLEAREFVSPVLRVTPVIIKTKSGSDVLIRVTMKKEAGFDFRKEADILYLDIKHPADMPVAAETQKTATTQKAAAPVKDEQMLQAAEQQNTSGRRMYSGRKVTLEFADAEVRKIFQLLSEVSNKNFVLGDEVTGTISLKLVNVPWDQALDIILDTKGLDKREEGNIVLIRGKGKFKSLMDEEVEIKKAALKGEPLETEIFEVNYSDVAGIVTQFNALKTDRGVITSDARTNKVIVKDVRAVLTDMSKLLKSLDVPEKQVMIEARIVEASTDFSRSLGISWSLGTNPAAGGQHWPFINSANSVFGGIANTPGTSAIGSTTGAADITFGTIGANVRLSMRLNAAAKAGMVRIISSPKVATLNNKSAKITQGKQIPYISSTSDKVETKFVEAALSLEVTPHINNNGTIVLKVDAKNDAPDTTSTSTTPPINKKQATTEMLLKDGETTVIGGIFVDSESEGEEGIPWLMDIPILGNLFKSKNYVKGKTELLIFITPRILNNAV